MEMAALHCTLTPFQHPPNAIKNSLKKPFTIPKTCHKVFGKPKKCSYLYYIINKKQLKALQYLNNNNIQPTEFLEVILEELDIRYNHHIGVWLINYTS